ncbi:MAG TPA: ankyrin repeat domain-containing protein [Thermoanaerobaculia bacterium]|nr:ankyrin repeat domain-containing protein [Thermoanaerobaculia bacterium]
MNFDKAIAAIDAGDVATLERLLADDPRLARERLDEPTEGYFARPYLLWFVAENPIRNETLPPNIVEVTRAILRAAPHEQEVLDYAVELVATGRVPRECGVQIALIDALIDAGAHPSGLHITLAHREMDAAKHLLARGAELTLAAAICLGRRDDVERLAKTPQDLQTAVAAAAFYGDAEALRLLIGLGADINAYCPAGFHAHSTPLHQAVYSGSLEAVKVLVEAGADRTARDRMYDGTPRGWAEYCKQGEIAEYLLQLQ